MKIMQKFDTSKIISSAILKYLDSASVSGTIKASPLYRSDLVGYPFDRLTQDLVFKPREEVELHNCWLRFLENRGVKFDVLIDIGAHIGTTTLILRDVFRSIHCFEPMKKTFELLRLNTQDYSHIKLYNFALGSTSKDLSIGYGDGYLSGASLNSQPNSSGSETVKLTTLDACFSNLECDNLLIKIDVESFEDEVLKGAGDLIQKHRPIIIMEVLKRTIQNGNSASVQFLKDRGYSFYNPQPKYTGNNWFVRKLKTSSEFEMQPVNVLKSQQGLYKALVCIPD